MNIKLPCAHCGGLSTFDPVVGWVCPECFCPGVQEPEFENVQIIQEFKTVFVLTEERVVLL